MRMLKSFDRGRRLVTLGSDSNIHTYDFIRFLADEAKIDFPDLEDSEIRVERLEGKNYLGTWVIQFSRPEAPPQYQEH